MMLLYLTVCASSLCRAKLESLAQTPYPSSKMIQADDIAQAVHLF